MRTETENILQYLSDETCAELSRVLSKCWSELPGKSFMDVFKRHQDIKGFDLLFDLMNIADRQYLQNELAKQQ